MLNSLLINSLFYQTLKLLEINECYTYSKNHTPSKNLMEVIRNNESTILSFISALKNICSYSAPMNNGSSITITQIPAQQ